MYGEDIDCGEKGRSANWLRSRDRIIAWVLLPLLLSDFIIIGKSDGRENISSSFRMLESI